MNIRWYGIATVAYSEEGRAIIFDPFLPWKRKQRHFSAENLAVGDVFITHGHLDHLYDVPEVTRRGGGPVYCPEEVARTLKREGVKEERIITVTPGDVVKTGPFDISVLRGKHIEYDRKLLLQTFLSPRIPLYLMNFRKILKENRGYPEGQTLHYLISAKGKRILHMGSLNLVDDEVYPLEVDLLALPFQGRSDMDEYALGFVRRLSPRLVYLHHFDDAFPPVSRRVETRGFTEKMRRCLPEVVVLVPEPGQTITI